MVTVTLGRVGLCALLAVVGCGGTGFSSIGDAGYDGTSNEGGAPGTEGGSDATAAGDAIASDGATGDTGKGDGAGGAGDAGDAAAVDGATNDGGKGDGGDGGTPGTGTYCGPGLVCSGAPPQQGTLCCVDQNTTPAKYGCAAVECGCATQLACSSDTGCQAGWSCCIEDRQDATCGSGHFVATCQATACSNNQEHMCDPSALTNPCPGGQVCNPDTGGVNLPIAGFGICN